MSCPTPTWRYIDVWGLLGPLFLGCDCVEPFEAALDFQPIDAHWNPLYGEKTLECFPQKPEFICSWRKKDMKILDGMMIGKLFLEWTNLLKAIVGDFLFLQLNSKDF